MAMPHSYRGATPPCVFVQANCGSTPNASQRWKFLQLDDDEIGNSDSVTVQIVHAVEGLCLASRCSSVHNCSAAHLSVFQHNQLEVIACDNTSQRQVCTCVKLSASASPILRRNTFDTHKYYYGSILYIVEGSLSLCIVPRLTKVACSTSCSAGWWKSLLAMTRLGSCRP